MTEAQLREKIKEWDLFGSPIDEPSDVSKYSGLMDKIDFFARSGRLRYLPAEHTDYSANYVTRLARWVGNVDDEQNQKLLLEYALRITFFSHDDVCALYRAAFTGPIIRWIIELEKLQIPDPKFAERIHEELQHRTWDRPITDSMDINEFYHVNHIHGIKHRPAFSTMTMLDRQKEGEPSDPRSRLVSNLVNYMNNPAPRDRAAPLSRLVLLEDFVGSGTQVAGAIDWAAEKLQVPILFVPLVICPPGLLRLSELEGKYKGTLSVRPVLALQRGDLLGPERKDHAGLDIAEEVEELANQTFATVTGSDDHSADLPPYTPFGFRQTGCSLASYSNTPNNTLPLIHHRSPNGDWAPLFPRSSRA